MKSFRVKRSATHDDDDCDGQTDEALVLGTCETGLMGVCGEGMLVCESGRSTCEQTGTVDAETCDGKDNDCNGATDEGEIASASCYPDDTNGCEIVDGEYKCVGVCRAGISLCERGMMRDCASAVVPIEELCGPQGDRTSAEDEDCDGKIDEMCNCENDRIQPCYTGPEGTLGVGECDRGEQKCIDREWDTCLGGMLPKPETCANVGEDNDCNGVDFVPGGKICIDQDAEGRCAYGIEQCVEGELTCVLNQMRDEQCDSTDDDCDGNVDEDFDLQTDEQNCGGCGNSCDDDDECCGRHCVDTGSDANNCGGCGVKCGSGQTCCNGGCIDTATDENNCGGCGMNCGADTCCNGLCFNLKSAKDHCGSCEISCGSGMCCTGVCKALLCVL